MKCLLPGTHGDISNRAQHSFLPSPMQSQDSSHRKGTASPSEWRARQSPGLTILDTSTRFVSLLWTPIAMISVHVFSVRFSYMPLQYRTCHCCHFWPSLCCNCSSSRLRPGSHTYAKSSVLCRAGGQQQFDHG